MVGNLKFATGCRRLATGLAASAENIIIYSEQVIFIFGFLTPYCVAV